MNDDDRRALETLDLRVREILPDLYQDSYDDVQPVSMGSAGLKFGSDDKVAWDEMWATFCDLAMAGGPPHKGTFLEPATRAEIDAQTDRYDEVTEEICRGIVLVSDLTASVSPNCGWVRVGCLSETMAEWLARAIVMENVAARREGRMLDLPAGPGYRLEKEIKNVITVTAKTCHYWMGHMPRSQKASITDLFMKMARESPLVQPVYRSDGTGAGGDEVRAGRVAADIERMTGFQRSSHRYVGWLGLECAGVRGAIWMMRALVVSNVLSRREGTVLFVPINGARDPDGSIVVDLVARMHRLASMRGVF